MDRVVAAAQGRQQADRGGPVQQRDRGLAGQPGQLGHRVVDGGAGVAHEAEGVGVDGVAEQVQHRELAALSVGEGVGEPVGQGGGQRPGPAQRGVLSRFQFGFPGPEPGHERLDLGGGGQAVAEGLADQDGDGQRVACGVAQQRPPVDPRIEPGRGGRRARRRAGGVRASASAAARSRAGQITQPVLFVAAGGQQHLAPRLWRQVTQEPREVVLLGLGPGAGGAGREPGDRLDVVPHPQHRHLRQHLHAPGPGARAGLVVACQWIPFASSSAAKQSPAASSSRSTGR